MKKAIEPEDINKEHINVSPAIKRKQPNWWKDIWGSFHDMQDHQFNIEYIKNQGESYKPLEIYASKDKNGKLIPITSDLDLLWISNPSEDHPLVKAAAEKHSIDIREVINTFKTDGSGVIEMRNALQAICNVDTEKRLDLEKITDVRLGEIGCATPFEAYVILVINQRFAEFVNHVQDLLQHGADNRSPYAPSDIEKTLHIMHGLSVLTKNGSDLRKLVKQDDYLESFAIDLHPELDMKKWAAVVEKQLSCGQKISAELQAHYNEERLANASPLHRRASAGLEALKGKFSRLRSSTFSTHQPRRKRSSPASQRKSSLPNGVAAEQRRASAPVIKGHEPTLRLEREYNELYKEDDAFLSLANQKKVIDLCKDLNKENPAWNWSMPMKGLVHGRNNGTNQDVYINITNKSIEVKSEMITVPTAIAIYNLQQTLSPNEPLNIRASEINTSIYEKLIPDDGRETKKL